MIFKDKETIEKIISGQKTILVLPLLQVFNFSLDKYIDVNNDYKIMITKRETIGDCNELSYRQLKQDCGTLCETDDGIYLNHVNYFCKLFPNNYRHDSCYVYNFTLIKKVKSTMKMYVAIQQLSKTGVIVDDDYSRVAFVRDGVFEQYYKGEPLGVDFNLNSDGWKLINGMSFTEAIESKKNCVGLLSCGQIKYIDGKLQNKEFLKDEVSDIWIVKGK